MHRDLSFFKGIIIENNGTIYKMFKRNCLNEWIVLCTCLSSFFVLCVKERAIVYMCSCGMPVTQLLSCFCEVWVWCLRCDKHKISFLGQWHTKTLNRSGTFAFRGLKTDCISVWLTTCLACTINVLSTNLRCFWIFIYCLTVMTVVYLFI